MAKKKSRRRKQSRRSRLPLLVVVAVTAAGAAYYWWGEKDPTPGTVVPIETTVAPDVTDSTPVADTSPIVSTVAPPITVHSDTLGDVEFDQLLDDWTVVDAPVPPAHSAPIEPDWVVGNRIDVSLPDGIYWGYLQGVFDEDVRGFNFDVAQVHFGIDACREVFGDSEDVCWDNYGITRVAGGDQLYPAYLDDLLYTSVFLYPTDDGTLRDAFVAPTRLWEIVQTGEEVADSPIRSWYLLTIIDGKVIAAEGVYTP